MNFTLIQGILDLQGWPNNAAAGGGFRIVQDGKGGLGGIQFRQGSLNLDLMIHRRGSVAAAIVGGGGSKFEGIAILVTLNGRTRRDDMLDTHTNLNSLGRFPGQ
eukprot:scaffold34682_cov243-Amphora_coffeaeformis.AAC.14